MTLKQTLLIGVTHTMWELVGAAAVLRPTSEIYILGLFVGLLTYFTYSNLLKGE